MYWWAIDATINSQDSITQTPTHTVTTTVPYEGMRIIDRINFQCTRICEGVNAAISPQSTISFAFEIFISFLSNKGCDAFYWVVSYDETGFIRYSIHTSVYADNHATPLRMSLSLPPQYTKEFPTLEIVSLLFDLAS